MLNIKEDMLAEKNEVKLSIFMFPALSCNIYYVDHITICITGYRFKLAI